MLPLCYQEGVAVIPWSPLALGPSDASREKPPHGWCRMKWGKISTKKAMKMTRTNCRTLNGRQ